MSGHRVSILLAAAFLTIGTMALAVDPLPEGWMGGNTKSYEVGVDRDVVKSGKAAATIKARTATPENFGTILQSFDATAYLDKRVRMSAFVKADKVEDWAGLWMRVDGEDKDNPTLSFDNMQSRPIKGTKDWQNYEIVLDVPAASKSITFGILLSGPGQAWLDDFKFEIVAEDVPTTGMSMGNQRTQPIGLGFED